MNMHEAAEQWVTEHVASCTKPTCGCRTEGDRPRMVDALIARWLGMEEPA
jgi:hypothetical protein